ncbi:dual specificity protein phosphatase family protein [Roseimaritima ulvae]|uniref:Dual specificity phosphatase, catalytic domain n=1 Tax=Roseimaritima ulvae TaxID=980254 RepID=A0A5B9R296_9BACT|nr:dual specificity protein phosphatase family protein [Roseimaritima ulvae]QEG40361.1 hypothetical protein UC8_23700 [Roseimaritima ulvae]
MPPPKRLQRFYARSVFYPTLWWNMLHGRVLKIRHWSTRIDANLIVGAYPFARDVPKMAADGVRAVVNTCEEYPGPVDAYALAGIEQLHIPTTDFTHPRLEDIEQAVEFIEQHAQGGATTYVHCKAGRARSATVALCWLVKYRGMSAEDAQSTLLKLRPHVNPRVAQRPVVQDFVAKLDA